jgi:hypothetical protein
MIAALHRRNRDAVAVLLALCRMKSSSSRRYLVTGRAAIGKQAGINTPRLVSRALSALRAERLITFSVQAKMDANGQKRGGGYRIFIAKKASQGVSACVISIGKRDSQGASAKTVSIGKRDSQGACCPYGQKGAARPADAPCAPETATANGNGHHPPEAEPEQATITPEQLAALGRAPVAAGTGAGPEKVNLMATLYPETRR